MNIYNSRKQLEVFECTLNVMQVRFDQRPNVRFRSDMHTCWIPTTTSVTMTRTNTMPMISGEVKYTLVELASTCFYENKMAAEIRTK